MSNINYKLVYEARKAGLNTNSLDNIKVFYRNEADKMAEEEHQKYLDFLRARLNSDSEFEVTNTYCLADDIQGHVYVGSKDVVRGIGHRRCCFCGCDDFDD